MNIQKDLRKFFSDTGMTQGKLSQLSGVSQSTLSKITRGKGCHSSVVERLWPYLYGDKRPKPEPKHDQAA